MRIIKFLLAMILLLSVTASADYEETKILNLSADGIKELQIDCGAGYLEIMGVEGLTAIEVEAEIYIEGMKRSKAEDFIEDNMNLSLRERGKSARLISTFEHTGFSFGLFSAFKSYGINLTVRLPIDMIIDIDDGSGDSSGDIRLIDIEGNTRLEDGSGDIIFDNIRGNIILDDGSGDIEIEQVTGSIELDDGSGAIYAIKIKGDFFIDDGSGDIDLKDISGDVEIDDSSGNMELFKIGGTVIVDDGSGNIRIDKVKGDVEIIDDNSGRCRITNVEGRIID